MPFRGNTVGTTKVLEQVVFKLREFKVVVLLFNLNRVIVRVVRTPTIDQIALTQKHLVAHAVEALVDFLVDVAVRLAATPKLLGCSLVYLATSADKVVVRETKSCFELIKARSKVVDVGLSALPALVGLFGNFLTMLVGAGIKKDLVPH